MGYEMINGDVEIVLSAGRSHKRGQSFVWFTAIALVQSLALISDFATPE
jgi:hypothetical protein